VFLHRVACRNNKYPRNLRKVPTALCYNALMRVSLILTVKNEAAAIAPLFDSILGQTRAPDEIIVADGGSTDGTLERLRDYTSRLPIKILAVPGSNISQGRNAAIRASSGDVICSTDAGVRLDEHWVEELLKPFEDNAKDEGTLRGMKDENSNSASSFTPALRRTQGGASVLHPSSFDVVSGFFLPDPHSVFETALAATTLPALADIRPEKFLPSSRSIAFRKAAWEQVNGYPEWLDFCEDLVFDFALRAQNFRFAFAPKAIVHFRPRQNLRAFFKQYYQYARGDGKANLWFLRHAIRYATYLVALPSGIALALSSFWFLGFGLLGFGILGMFYTPYKRLFPMMEKYSFAARARAMLSVPVIRVAGDVAKMLGYPVGVAWRWQNGKPR